MLTKRRIRQLTIFLAVLASEYSMLVRSEDQKVPVSDEGPDQALMQQNDENSESHSDSNANQNGNNCAWGTACHHSHEREEIETVHNGERNKGEERAEEAVDTHPQEERPEVPVEKKNESTGAPSTSTGEKLSGHLPFVHHSHPNSHFIPPEGFSVTARVYTDPADKLAHFTDDTKDAHITLPYWECGATGSTTSPLPVKHAYFRHALSGSKPRVWSGTEYGPHPQLVVALKRMEMTLNSGETKQLKPGDVVLLEDVVSGGHKLTSLENEFDMTYLLLILPQHYHHVGKDQFSLKRMSTTKQSSPCNNHVEPGSAFIPNKAEVKDGMTSPDSSSSSTSFSWDAVASGDIAAAIPLNEGRTRKLLLGAVGLSLSTLVADFLGKVAPLWVAVGIGGTCFVAGGTAAFVKCGDYVIEEIEMWQERKRLDAPFYEEEGDSEAEQKNREKAASEESSADIPS